MRHSLHLLALGLPLCAAPLGCAPSEGVRETGADPSSTSGKSDAVSDGATDTDQTGEAVGPISLDEVCLAAAQPVAWTGLPPLAYRDITGDGRADALVVGFVGDEWTATVFLGGDASTRWQTAVPTVLPRAEQLLLDDVDGDGRGDILSPIDVLRIHQGTDGGELLPMDAMFSVVPYIGFTTADFDDDGQLDLVGATFEDRLQSLRGTGSGDFELAAGLDLTAPQDAMVLYPDVTTHKSIGVMTGVAAGCIDCTQSGFSLIRLDPDGAMRITAEVTWGTVWTLIQPTIGELFGGGTPEVIVDLGTDQRTVFGVEDGELVATGALPNGPEAFGDINGDGPRELVLHDGAAIRIFTDGQTQLEEVLTVNSPSAPEIHAADVDANGLDDVVLFYPAGVDPAAGQTAPTILVHRAQPCSG